MGAAVLAHTNPKEYRPLRRFMAVLVAAFVLATAVTPATAGRRWSDNPDPDVRTQVAHRPSEVGEIQSNYPDNCAVISNGESNGSVSSSPSISRSGAKAIIDIPTFSNGFAPCTNNITLEKAGPSAYVGMMARNGCCGYHDPVAGSPDGGIFVGVISCEQYDPPVTFCQGAGDYRYFVGVNPGCGIHPTTTTYDHGVAGTGATWFTIYLSTDSLWHISIGGSQVRTVSASSQCWDDGSLEQAVYSTSGLNHEDSYGNSSSTSTWLYDAHYGVYGQGWFTNPFLSGSNCAWDQADDACDIIGQDEIKVWTP